MSESQTSQQRPLAAHPSLPCSRSFSSSRPGHGGHCSGTDVSSLSTAPDPPVAKMRKRQGVKTLQILRTLLWSRLNAGIRGHKQQRYLWVDLLKHTKTLIENFIPSCYLRMSHFSRNLSYYTTTFK